MTLQDRYRGIVCDLDGVVYRSHEAIPHAVAALEGAREAGLKIAYATNNAARPPQEVRDHLEELGLTVELPAVVTSSMAGAHHLAQHLPAGSAVLAIGGDGVVLALRDEGLKPVRAADLQDAGDDAPAAVLQGFGREVGWKDLARGAFAVQAGARWVATNMDLSIPVSGGIAPGNGSLVNALRQAVDVDPEVVGKPYPPLYLRAAETLECEPGETLAIGDRLDTDVEGAHRTGMDSLFVLTGVNGPKDIVAAPAERRPTYLATDLRALAEDYTEPQVEEDADTTRATCGGATVEITTTTMTLGRQGTPDERLRALVAAGLRHVDRGADLPTWPDVDAWIQDGDR